MKFLSIVMLYAHYDDHYEVDLIESLALLRAGGLTAAIYFGWWGGEALVRMYVGGG